MKFKCPECDGIGVKWSMCNVCGGSGVVGEGADCVRCERCHGTGVWHHRWNQKNNNGERYFMISLMPIVSGQKEESEIIKIKAIECRRCRGTGFTESMATIGDMIAAKEKQRADRARG